LYSPGLNILNVRYQGHLERLKNSDLNLIIGTGAQINMLIQADKMEADVETNVAQTSSF
jgi:hypothetical protein